MRLHERLDAIMSSRLDSTARMVLVVLAGAMSTTDEDRPVWLSADSIAERAGVSRSTAIATLGRLATAGIVLPTPRVDGLIDRRIEWARLAEYEPQPTQRGGSSLRTGVQSSDGGPDSGRGSEHRTGGVQILDPGGPKIGLGGSEDWTGGGPKTGPNPTHVIQPNDPTQGSDQAIRATAREPRPEVPHVQPQQTPTDLPPVVPDPDIGTRRVAAARWEDSDAWHRAVGACADLHEVLTRRPAPMIRPGGTVSRAIVAALTGPLGERYARRVELLTAAARGEPSTPQAHEAIRMVREVWIPRDTARGQDGVAKSLSALLSAEPQATTAAVDRSVADDVPLVPPPAARPAATPRTYGDVPSIDAVREVLRRRGMLPDDTEVIDGH